MRIGIVPLLAPSAGGVYQYSLTALQSLDQSPEVLAANEFIILTQEPKLLKAAGLTSRRWQVKPLEPVNRLDPLRRLVGEGPHRKAWRWYLKSRGRLKTIAPAPVRPDPDVIRSQPEMTQWFHKCGVDFLVYLTSNKLSFEAGLPYAMAIHDLQHRLQPEFPEVSADGEWERREYLYRQATRHATLILADSDTGKEDILNCYGETGLQPDQVKVLPYQPAYRPTVALSPAQKKSLSDRYRLPKRFLFYPAQFWPHKNHARIVQAIRLLQQEQNLTVNVVFSGSHSGQLREQTFADMMTLAAKLGVTNQIHHLGYLPDEDMAAMYTAAVALVMPTFFGPTNIPPMEAWAFGCPVLTSDIRGIREHSGNAALLVDPRSAEAIADGIGKLWTDEKLRQTLAAQGKLRLAQYTPEDFRERLKSILAEACDRVANSKHPQPSTRSSSN